MLGTEGNEAGKTEEKKGEKKYIVKCILGAEETV